MLASRWEIKARIIQLKDRYCIKINDEWELFVCHDPISIVYEHKLSLHCAEYRVVNNHYSLNKRDSKIKHL